MIDTFPICGYHLAPGQFASRTFNTDSSDGQLFANCKPNYYLSEDGERLFELPRGGQSDGISAPQIAAAVGREHGGEDWPAGWLHDGGYRCWLRLWVPDASGDDGEWVKWTAPYGRSKEACDKLLYEAAMACGDTEVMAKTLYWAVVEFGKRNYLPDHP